MPDNNIDTARFWGNCATQLTPAGQPADWGPDNSIVFTAEEDVGLWAPEGKRLLFGWQESRVSNLFWQPYDGSSPMERLTTSEFDQFAGSWAEDGKTVALVEWPLGASPDIVVLDVRSGRVTRFLNSPFMEMYPNFSPDGRWIAYTSNESKRDEVYVRPFPGPGMKTQVSNEGGASARARHRNDPRPELVRGTQAPCAGRKEVRMPASGSPEVEDAKKRLAKLC